MSNVINKKENNIWIHELISNIVDWHHARNLIGGSDNKNQTLKLVQEFGELSGNLSSGESIVDDIGDMIVVLINLMEREGINFKDSFVHPNSTPGKPIPNDPTSNKGLAGHIEDYLNFQSNMYHLKSGATIQLYLDLSHQMGLLSDFVCKQQKIHESVGRILRGLIMLAECYDITIQNCLQQAWDDIKDRKGMMIDGIFVKEADLT